MVDVSAKKVTGRVAEASAMVRLSPATIAILREHGGPKGDPIEAARIAGIMAAKKTADLIPLCHPLALTDVAVKADLMDDGVRLSATVRTNAQTGVEMEALTAVSVAALTIYDMCKAVQRDIEITDIRLESKTGGKRPYKRK
jgi:cyclic pyranopterin phosphate synthase